MLKTHNRDKNVKTEIKKKFNIYSIVVVVVVTTAAGQGTGLWKIRFFACFNNIVINLSKKRKKDKRHFRKYTQMMKEI